MNSKTSRIKLINTNIFGIDTKEVVPCMWCATPTPYLATKHCNNCWELYWNIKYNPEVAKQMLKELSK
jgi:hypothetical protein